jgi:hypothetical protein
MDNLKLGPALVRGLAAGILLLGLAGLRPRPAPRPAAGPRTLAEVARIAGRLGLHCRTDRQDGGASCRLVVSDRPLTFDRANYLPARPGHSCWRGTVAATLDGRRDYDDYDRTVQDSRPGWSARWGDFYLFGDPALIRKLRGCK